MDEILCGKCGHGPFRDKRGLNGHFQLKHPGEAPFIAPPTANLGNSAVETPPRPAPDQPKSPETKTAVAVENKQEATNMPKSAENNTEHTGECPLCKIREQRIHELEHQVELSQQPAAETEQQIELPSVEEFIQHCESGNCGHKKDWGTVKEKIVQATIDNLPGEAIPNKIIESEALRRGYIPKKIIIG